MLSDRTKVVRGVLAFLAGCALLGFVMGLRGAMPGAVDPESESAPLAEPSGVVVEASPVSENLPVTTNEAALNEPAEEEAEEEEAEPAPPPQPATPQPATPAPKEEAPPADPVGELIEQPTPPPPLGEIY